MCPSRCKRLVRNNGAARGLLLVVDPKLFEDLVLGKHFTQDADTSFLRFRCLFKKRGECDEKCDEIINENAGGEVDWGE